MIKVFIKDILQQDLGSSLLSIAIIVGWLGISFVFLRILAIVLKQVLEKVFKKI